MVHFPKINPKTQLIDLHAARTKAGQGVTSQRFESLLGGGYTEVAEKSQVEKEIKQVPNPQRGGLWRKT